MKKILSIILFVFSVSICFASEKKIFAKVGDLVITEKDLNRIIDYYEPERKKAIQQNPQMKLAVLKQIIANSLIFKLAEESKFTEKPEIKEQLRLVKEHFVASVFLKEQVVKSVMVDEDDAKKYYQINLQEFVDVPEQVKARHILLKLSQNATEDEVRKVMEKAESIIKLIKEGADFGEMAKIHSDDPGTKSRGGDLGFFGKGRMVKPFEDAVFSMKVGDISAPVKTNFGIHIIKLEEKKEAKYKPYETVKEQVLKRALEEKQKKAVLDYMENLFKENKVQINEEEILEKK